MPKSKGLPNGVEYILNSDDEKVWRVRKMVKGEKIFKTFGTGKKAELEARVFAEQIQHARYSQDTTLLPSITISVKEAIKEYFQSIHHLAPLTIRSKKASYDRFENYFRDFQLRKINTYDLLNLFREQEDYKFTSLYVLKNNVSAFFKFLKASGYILEIPEIKLPVNLSYESECNRRRNPLTKNNLIIVMDNLPDSWWGNAIRIIAFTGMRLGEAKGLRWENVFDDYIQIKESFYFKPKSEKGIRQIPLHPVVKEIISNNRLNKTEVPIPGLNGKQMNTSQLNNNWLRFRQRLSKEKKIDVYDTRIHDLRHTFGMLMASKLNLPLLQRILGHSNIKQTAYYAQQTDDFIQKEIKEKGFPF